MKQVLLRLLAIVCMLGSYGAWANVVLPSVFGSGMVLQQNTEVTFWGWGKPGEGIVLTTTWNNYMVRTKVNNQGQWLLKVQTPLAGGPYQVTLKGYNTVVLEDVLIGEVWLCSGQSNMEWSARAGINNAEEEAKNANYPKIRFFTVWHRTADAPQLDIAGSGWAACTPQTMYDYGAVAYFFARKIHKELGDVPIGIINSSWGGTCAEVWTNPKYILQDSLLLAQSKKITEEEWGPNLPGRAYHAMIAPLKQFKIAGTLWYQGETNVSNGETYGALLSTMVKGWRQDWGYDFPFYYVQIAPWNYTRRYEGGVVRNAQRQALDSIENSGMVVISDIGDIENIHPKNKKEVGVRLADVALKYTYRRTEKEVLAPLYKSHEIKNDEIVITFDHVGSGLKSKGSKLTHFEIAGKGYKFVPAEAFIRDGKVVVKAKSVKEPYRVRFAWENTATPNLFNSEGLPASTFITE